MSRKPLQRSINVSLLVLTIATGTAHAAESNCGLANPAFCETFDAPAGIGNRSGDLDGRLWGVSRQIGGTNFGQGQYYDASPTTMQLCGQNVQVQPPHDVAICNGQLVERRPTSTASPRWRCIPSSRSTSQGVPVRSRSM